MFQWKLSKVWWTKSQLTLGSEWFSRGNVGFSQSEASLVVMVAADWLSASSWGPAPPPPWPSFCLPLAQDVRDGQRLQLITLQRPGLTPTVCLSSQAFAFAWVPAFCKLIRVCKCVCAHRRLHRLLPPHMNSDSQPYQCQRSAPGSLCCLSLWQAHLWCVRAACGLRVWHDAWCQP